GRAGGADLGDVGAGHAGRCALVGGLGLAGARVQFALGGIGRNRQRRTLGPDFLLADAAARVAPAVHHVGGDGGDVGVADVALGRHQAVVGDVVDDDLAFQPLKDGAGDIGGVLVPQRVRVRQRRERAGQALAVRLVAGGAVGL